MSVVELSTDSGSKVENSTRAVLGRGSGGREGTNTKNNCIRSYGLTTSGKCTQGFTSITFCIILFTASPVKKAEGHGDCGLTEVTQ